MSQSNRAIQTFIFFCFVTSLSNAQSLRDHLQKAERYFLKNDFANALKSYQDALTLDASDPLVNFKAGVSSLREEQYSQAVTYLAKAYELKPDVDDGINYHLGVAYQKDHQYEKAREQFETLKRKNKKLAPVAGQKIKECILADSVMRLKVSADIIAVPGEVNTPFAESAPLVSSDGRTMIFTSDRSEDNYQIKSRTNAGDVFVAEWNGTHWTQIRKISENLNVRPHDGGTSISADGKTLFLYYEDGGGDIYTSSLRDGVWEKPVALNQFINHPQYQETSASLSADGKKLFFASNRAGGKGGFDIYVSLMGANGQWGRPSNLGSAVNTRRDETSPFIHADNTTLYFASDGHATLGDKDLFRTTLQNGKWTSAQNLGYPINTSGYEEHFYLTNDGTVGFFTSRRGGKPGNTDIYQVRFNSQQVVAGPATDQHVQDSNENDGIVTILKGTVIDAGDATPLDATLTLVDNQTKELISRTKTDGAGNFQITLPRGGNYGLTTERQGYLFNSMHFDLPPFGKYQEIDTHILMVKASVGSKIILKNIFFDVNQSTLKPESLSELENIRELLMKHPQWHIQINGHTDNVGARETNIALSLKRAEAVVAYLVAHGIDAGRLKARGFGPDQPLVSNDDEKDGRQINRRTEVEIIAK